MSRFIFINIDLYFHRRRDAYKTLDDTCIAIPALSLRQKDEMTETIDEQEKNGYAVIYQYRKLYKRGYFLTK